MIRPRLWTALLLAGVTLGSGVSAQQSSGGASGSGGGSTGGSSSGAPGNAPSTGNPASAGSSPDTTGGSPGASSGSTPAATDAGAASSFGTPASGTPAAPSSGSRTTPSTGGGSGTSSGAGTTGGESAPPALPTEATTFTVPGAFGKPGETYVVGQGRLARPRFRFSGAVAIGYDDNIFSTPTKQQEFPDQTVEVLVRPAQPAQTVTVQDGTETVFLGGIEQTVPKFRTVTIPGTPAETGKVTIPGSKTEPREASLVERANIGLEVQFASRRTLLTLDLRLGAERTEARDKDPLQYNGSLGFRFAHKLAPRLQWNSSVDAVYSSQPDLSRINTPTTVTSGSYLDLVARTGLEYRWTPRIATSASITYHTLTFSDTSEQSGDYNDVTLSVEGRYLFSPRLKLVAEGRYSQIGYDNDFARDSHTSFALLGADLAWSRRTNSSLRAGVAIRDSELGETAYSPYLEFNLSYRLGQTSALQWNTRYGFEEPGDSTSKVLTLRNGLSYIQYFTPRLRAVAGGNIVYSTTTETTTDDSTTQLAFDTNLGFEYNINRRWSFTGTYSFTTVFSDNEFADYYRNRLFLGFEYTF